MEPEFHLKNHSFKEERIAFQYDPKKMDLLDANKQGTSKFFASSIFLHIVFVAGAAATSLVAIQHPKIETVEIEITDPGMSTSPNLPLAKLPSAPLPAAPELPQEEEAPPTQDDVVTPPPIKTAPPPPPPPAQKISQPKAETPKSVPAPKAVVEAPKQAQFKPAAVQTFKTESPVVIPDSVDDINETELDEEAIKAAPVVAKIDDEELGKDFSKIDESHQKQVVAVAQDLNSQTDSALNETEGLANQLNEETEAEAEKIAAYNAARRARDAQAVAAAQASERAAAARAAQEAAAAQAAAEAAAQARAKETQVGTGLAPGHGTGEVRSLDQLRQKPGNPVPRYDDQERLQGQAGEVIFVAFVNEAGIPADFKMVKSSGHRNLDAKTLKALKQWRFYPGQAGLVEFPFKWDLKGDAGIMPARLRTK